MHAKKRSKIEQSLAALRPANPHYETLRRIYRRMLGLEAYAPAMLARMADGAQSADTPKGGE